MSMSELSSLISIIPWIVSASNAPASNMTYYKLESVSDSNESNKTQLSNVSGVWSL